MQPETGCGFNRRYMRQIGAISRVYLQSPFSLAEVRVLYELAHRRLPAASELADDLGLAPRYLSRILRGLGASLLGEQVSAAFGLGLACVALGLWLAHRQ